METTGRGLVVVATVANLVRVVEEEKKREVRDVGRYVGDWWEGCFEKSEGEAMCELVTLS